MAMEVNIRDSKWVIGRERRQSGMHLSHFRADMDDNSAMYKRLLVVSQHQDQA